MTSAPPELQRIRQYVITNFHVDPDAVGIVGDPKHLGGYHCGRDRIVSNDYSVYESDRDRKGFSDYASALDIGKFNHNGMSLPHFSKWAVERCKAGTLDTANIREIIYSPDGNTVLRWDRLKKRKGGSDDHLTHTHISYFRDSSNSTKNLALFQRYIQEMTAMDKDDVKTLLYTDGVLKTPESAQPTDNEYWTLAGLLSNIRDLEAENKKTLAALTAKVDAMQPVAYFQLTDTQFNLLVDRMADNA